MWHCFCATSGNTAKSKLITFPYTFSKNHERVPLHPTIPHGPLYIKSSPHKVPRSLPDSPSH
jgi:hypothetical protein